jgi:hypothetical protein
VVDLAQRLANPAPTLAANILNRRLGESGAVVAAEANIMGEVVRVEALSHALHKLRNSFAGSFIRAL